MQRPARYFQKKGFTLIELLVAVAIGGILFSGGLAAYRGIGEKQTVKQAGISFQSKLRLFQQKALAGEKPSECDIPGEILEGYSVRWISLTSYIMTAVCSITSPTENTINLVENVVFGGNFGTIFFPVLRSELTGAQVITLTNGTFNYEVEIESTGVIRGEMLEI